MTDPIAALRDITPGSGVGVLASVSIDCPDPAALAEFYAPLLGMKQFYRASDGQVVSLSNGSVAVTLMRVAGYVAPTWPEPGQLQQMHLDLAVTDLEDAVTAALGLGAVEAPHQAMPDRWRVMLDPVGHPFCLTIVRGD